MSIYIFLGPLLYTLCIGSIPVVTTRENIALNGSANQSTTLNYNGFQWNASLAIDGYTIGREDPDFKRCCSGTNKETVSWWQVDLHAEYMIGKINVYGRTLDNSEQLRGFRLYIIPNGNFASSPDYLVHTDRITSAQYFAQKAIYTIYTHHKGRYVQIELPRANHLVVCEVEVFEVCPDHFYGDDCLDTCGRCKNNSICHPTNGRCQHGCEPGFLPDMCAEECTDGYFGYNCTNKCGQCKDKHPCDKANGQCTACAAGYRGATCSQECAEFKYGEGCQLECGHCKDNISCNHIDGSCDSCVAGFQLPRCKIACTNGSYGENCRLECGNCRGDAACNKSNGHCSSCAAGYTGIICKEKCSNFTYGENCSGKCGHCRFGADCNYVTGLCRNCEDGYYNSDKYCTTECTGGKYGYLCNYTCGRCKNGSVCNKTNGTCSHGCAAGYEGHKCNNKCSGKTFGEDCKMKCHCKNDVACDTVTGSCPDGLCDLGWDGHDCNTDLNFVYRLESLTTSMSTPIYQGMNSSLAVDDNDSPLPDTCQCCSVSIADTPWWILDMKKIYPIKLVVFVGRENGYGQFGSFRLYLSNTSDMFGDHVYQAPSQPTNYIIKIPVENKMASVVKIDRNENTLTICEVKIYEGECPLGTYGDRCGNECHCADGLTCDIINGSCKNSGCHPGWLGEACNEECMNGTFGVNCTEQCHCNNNIACNKSTGSCGRSGCSPGWIGLNCSTACDAGFYGLNCSQMCGNCANNMACDKTTGDCVYGCDSKYEGPKCVAELPGKEGDGPNSSFSVSGVVIGLVLLLLLVVAIVVVVIRKRKYKSKLQEPNTQDLQKLTDQKNNKLANSVCETSLGEVTAQDGFTDSEYYSFSPRKTDVHIHHLWDYVNENKANGAEYFANEFKTLPRGLKNPCETALKPENSNKNRYKDMYAYDHSRVVLCEKDDEGSDYINACYINGYEKLKKFIAAQGPTENTINDFWKMVWQEDVSTVVMLTGLVEIGHIKCMQYWPDEDQETYGSLKVSIKVCEELTDYIVRTLELTKDGYESRLVRQYHFKAWPDKTVPDTAWSLVQFWRAVMSRSSTNNRPIIVHCSAGVGRTGTFIALDNLYHQAAEEGSLRPLQMIENLRRQRVNMVQTKDQYVFLHEAVAEAFYFGTYSVFLNQFEEWYNFMNREDMNSDKSRLAKQYELLEKSATEVYTKSENATEAVYANATENVLHCDTLAPDGEQSWNPLEIEAYNRKKCFIVCTTPIADARAKYSQLIKEKHIKTAVLISEKEENSLKGQYDEENVKVFVFEWKSDSPLPLTMESFLEKLDSLQNWQSFPNNTEPILVHCRSILANCMTVCIVLGEMQRVKLDGAVNILETTKIASGNTTALLPSFEQYRFCHELILKTCCQQPDVYANVSTKRTT